MRVSCEIEKLYRSNKPLGYILKCNENIRKDIFRESELKPLSTKDFNSLLNSHVLVETYQDPEQTTYFDTNKTAYRVRRYGNGFRGYRISGEGDATILLTKADNKFYRFDFSVFCRWLKNNNYLRGKYSEVTPRLHFVGNKEKDDGEIGLLVGLFESDSTAKRELLALQAGLSQYRYFLVVCPDFELNEELSSRLVDKGIFCRTFASAVDNNLKIDFGIAKARSSEVKGFSVPALTGTEKKKYKKDYPRKDVIEFYDSAKGYFVRVNGNELEFDRVEYGLLLFLAKALKANKDGGTITVSDTVNANIVRDPQHFYRVSSGLNKLMKNAVENRKEKIVSNIRSEGKYRLTTMPNRIKQPHTKWLDIRLNAVKLQIEEERQRRGIELNHPV